jgi:hypothetical protein
MVTRKTIHNPVAHANRRRVTQVVPSHGGKGTKDKRKEDKKHAFKLEKNAYQKGE